MKRMLFVSICFIICLCLVSCNKEQQPTITIGFEGCYAPFNWTENKKTESNVKVFGTNQYVDGYDVQIAKRIAEALDCELVIKLFDWNGLTPAVEDGVIDLIIAGMSPIPERKLDIDFTDPYYISEHVVIVTKTSPFADVTSVSEMTGAKMIGQIGTLYERIVNATPEFIVGIHKEKVPEIINDIKYGIVDGTVLELPVAEGVVKANPDLVMVRFIDGEGFNVSEEDKVVSIGIAKGRDELREKINTILSSITTEERTALMAKAVDEQSE